MIVVNIFIFSVLMLVRFCSETYAEITLFGAYK